MIWLFISRLLTVSPLPTKSASPGAIGRQVSLHPQGSAQSLSALPGRHVTPDGEIVWRFKQRTSDLRPGERLTLLQLMKDMYLDRFALAGGEGAAILRRAKRRALRDLPK